VPFLSGIVCCHSEPVANRFDKKLNLAIVLRIVTAPLAPAMLTLSGALQLWKISVSTFASGIL
jgi:hypothetical protein